MNHVNMRLSIARIPYTKGFPAQLVDSLVWNGQRGVQIFFAVSGFLITSTTLRRWGKLSDIVPRRFYLLRFARIAPLLLLLLAVLSGLDLAHVKNFVVSAKTGGLGRALLAALTFHINVLEARRGYLPANWDILWSLSVEEMFYLFFPLVCLLLGRGRWLITVLLMFVALGPLSRTAWSRGNGVWEEYSYLGGTDAIALGCLTAIVVARRQLPWRALAAAGISILIFTLCFSIETRRLGLARTGLDMTLLAIGTCMTIAAAAQTEWRSPLFLRPLASLGQRSYEVYLTHMFIVFGFFGLFLNADKPMSGVAPLFIAVILVAAALGYLVERFYSAPLNQRIRTLSSSR
jgi:peptidoglycan/LPS O-acetylase OafA/YrhL